MNAKTESTADKLARWVPIFKRFEESGLSQVKFCLQEKLSFPTFAKWWRRRNRPELVQVARQRSFIPVQFEIDGGAPDSVEHSLELVVTLPMGVTLCFKGRS